MLIKLKFHFPELFLGVLMAVAIFAMGMLFGSSPNSNQPTQAQSTEKTESTNGNHGQKEASWHDPIAVLTLGLVLVGLFQAGLFFVQLRLMNKGVIDAAIAARAAERAAGIAERALVGVERPVLLIRMPSGGINVPSHWLSADKPIYGVVVENVGKQVATIISGNANFVIQKESLPPASVALAPPADTFCHIRVVGEITLKKGEHKAFIGQRSSALTKEESTGLQDRSLYGFFRVSFVYADPIGTLRNSIFAFVYVPPDTPGYTDPFAQVLSEDRILPKATANQQKDAQRNLVGSLLEFYWGIDKEKSPKPK